MTQKLTRKMWLKIDQYNHHYEEGIVKLLDSFSCCVMWWYDRKKPISFTASENQLSKQIKFDHTQENMNDWFVSNISLILISAFIDRHSRQRRNKYLLLVFSDVKETSAPYPFKLTSGNLPQICMMVLDSWFIQLFAFGHRIKENITTACKADVSVL